MLHAETIREIAGASAEVQRGTLPRLTLNLDLSPRDSPLNTCAQGLGSGLFGREARSEAFRGALFAHAVGDLLGSEDPRQEAVAITLDGGGDAANFDNVDSRTDEHEG